MRNGENSILFHIKVFFILITLVFIIIPTNSCDSTAGKYADSILSYSTCYGVEPALCFAIAETESHFNPQAKSAAGAIGIMQIMPKTAEWIAEQLDFEKYVIEDLYDVEVNLRFGIWYLSYLSVLFSSQWEVIAAYNAGEGKVKSWIEEEGVTRESIPFTETAEYVDKVERAIDRFRRKKYAAFD